MKGKEVQKGGNINIYVCVCVCVCVADSFCYTVETNNIVKQLYTNKN